MSPAKLRRLSTILVFGATLFAASVHAQRVADPAASNRRVSDPRPADADAIAPFKIHVADATLRDLKQRLSQARFADELADVGWDYGTNLAYLKGLVEYWRDRYDWRAQEKKLNEFDQYKTNIDGLGIHFIHQRSKNPDAMPLLLLNGWPSSIIEYTKVIGPLTDPVAYGGRLEDSFNVVIPAMPGFGFSDKPHERGYNPETIAGIWVKLMARLGYAHYAAHGSDWGSGIATRVALGDPAHVVGLHLAGCGGAPAPAGIQAVPPPSAQTLGPNGNVNAAHNRGYQEIQSTKPQTLGHGLSDSPVGLASWIVEKWYDWSDHAGDLEQTFTKDELLTNIMIYWVTKQRDFIRADLLREPTHAGGPAAFLALCRGYGACDRADGLRRLPVTVRSARDAGEHEPRSGPQGGRGAVQHRALHVDAAWRALPRLRAADAVGE